MDSLKQIAQDIQSCQRCELRQTATCPVPGVGIQGAKFMLVGEAPGKDEDEAGVPFVGKAGKRLDKLLELAGIDINDCYISNAVRCRPPSNRDPRKKEIQACVEFLYRELELVNPEYIITLGSTPLKIFTPHGVTQLHGTLFDAEVNGKMYHLISQYHPAAEFHNPRLRAVILDDWENLPETVPHDFIIRQGVGRNGKLTLDFTGLASVDTESDGSGGLGQWSVCYRDIQDRLVVTPFFGSGDYVDWDSCPVVMHNAKYDIREFIKNKIPVPKNIHDTMIMAYCLGLGRQAPKEDSKSKSGSDMVGGLGLKYLARRHLGMQMNTWQEMKDTSPEEKAEYNAKDSVATYLLAEKWLPILPKHYFTIDMPLLPVLMAMEDRGVMVDPKFLGQMGKELDNSLANYDELVKYLAYHNQAKQSYIYGTLGFEPWKFTDGGEPSTDKDVLEMIDDPLIKQVIEYKDLHKEKGTYVENYMEAATEDGRIHPEFKQTSTSTGRLSCARPNLQNVFKRDERVGLRALFVAPQGRKIVRVDYDQMEWRALAAITQDPTLLKALESGKKIHQVTAEQMGVSYDDAKTGNFAIQYGAQAWQLAQELKCTIGEAREFIKTYFQRFPGVKKYQDMMKEIALSEKKVTNHFGRTRRIDAMYAGDWRVRQEGIKEAINMPIQGTCAEVIKIAMIELHKLEAPMILQVHDELLFEVPWNDATEYAHWLKEFIPTVVDVNGMMFPIGVGVGNNWYEAMQKEIN